VENLISNDVLEWELENINKKIASMNGTAPEDLTERKQAVEFKLSFLQVQVQTGQLSEEAYFQQLKAKILFEKNLATKLVKQGQRLPAALALKRAKIMEKELQETTTE
jgi:hypothetical protein